MTTDPLYTDCPKCKSLMGEGCDWGSTLSHGRFHPDRIIAAHLADAPNVAENMNAGMVDAAFQRAIDEVA